MKNAFFLFPTLLLFFTSCTKDPVIFLSQGMMAGEATESSVTLQARLSAADTLIDGDIPGIAGFGKFEISQKEDFFKLSIFRLYWKQILFMTIF